MELIKAKDVNKIKGGHGLKPDQVSGFLRTRGVFPVKKVKGFNLFLKSEVEDLLKRRPYVQGLRKQYKIREYKKPELNENELYSSDIISIYKDCLPETALKSFASWSKLRNIPIIKTIKIKGAKFNVYSKKDIEKYIKNRKEKTQDQPISRLRPKKTKQETERKIECCHYLQCLDKAVFKNFKFNCPCCERYQKKEFKYYD